MSGRQCRHLSPPSKGDPVKKPAPKRRGSSGHGNQATVDAASAKGDLKTGDPKEDSKDPLEIKVGEGAQTVTVSHDMWGSAAIKGQNKLELKSPTVQGGHDKVTLDGAEESVTYSTVQEARDGTNTTSNGVSFKDGTYTHSRTSKKEDGRKRSKSLTLGNELAVAQKQTGSDGSSTDNSMSVKSGEAAMKSMSTSDAGVSGVEAKLTQDGGSVSFAVANHGFTVRQTESEQQILADVYVGDTVYSGGFTQNRDTGTTAGHFAASNAVAKTAASADVVLGRDQQSVDLDYSSKVAEFGAGFDHINRDGVHVGDSELLGEPAVTVDNLSSLHLHGKARYGVGAEVAAGGSTQLQVSQALAGRSSISQLEGDRIRTWRDALAAGGRFDVEAMPVGMAVERAESKECSAAALAEVALLEGRAGMGWSEVHQQGLARTESGFRIHDAVADLESVEAQANAKLLGLELAAGEYDAASTHRSALSFELDACDPAAMDYAQDYADLGLLPTWDVACAHQGRPELVEQLRRLLGTFRESGAHLNAVRERASGLVRTANAFVRRLEAEGELDDQCGVVNTETELSEGSSYDSELRLVGLYLGGWEGQTDDRRVRRTDAQGERYLEASWSAGTERGRRSGRVSGARGAASALAVDARESGVGVHLDLSAEAVALLGTQIREADGQGTLWPELAADSRRYWEAAATFESATEAGRDLLPPDLSKPWVDAPLPAARLVERLGEVRSAEDFAALPTPLQASFVQSAVAMRSTGALEALAAVGGMQDGEARGAALAAVGHALVDSPAELREQLRGMKGSLSPAAALGMELAAQGVAVDPVGLEAQRGASWAALVAELAPAARGNHARADLLMEVFQTARALGGAALVGAMLTQLDARTVARVFAQKSGWREGSRLHAFVNELLEGHPEQEAIRADWESIATAHTADVDSREETGRGYFETELDGSSLGDAGWSDTDRAVMRAQMEDLQRAPTPTAAERAAQRKQAQVLADSMYSGALEDALDAADPAALLQALEDYHAVAAPHGEACLSDWAERHKARIGHRMPAMRARMVRDEPQRFAELTGGWEMVEKMGAWMELKESSPLRRRFGM